MNEFKEKWMNDIRFRMDNHSEPLPVGLWEKIEADMQSAPKVVPMWRKWYSVAAAAAVVAITSSVSVILWNNNVGEDTMKMAGTISPIIKEEIITTQPKAELVLAEAIPVEDVIEPMAITSKVVSHDVLTVVDELSIDEAQPVVEETEVASEELPAEDDIQKKRVAMMKADREVQRRNASYMSMAYDGKGKSRGNNIQLGLSAGNTPYNSSSNFNGISRLSSRKLAMQSNDIVISESQDGDVTYSQVLFNNRDKQTYTDVKHSMPVSVGANVKWNINDKWGLETGLGYTYMYSELRSGANSYVKDKQKLHYIGVPLKLHRSIWGNELFSFYASAGGMVEKCVSGEIETLCVDESRGKSYESESVGEKPWQFSVTASVGAQVNFLKFMSLYVEPGMAYYFDDGSELLTIRKDKPFNFNLQFGFRFNIWK